MEKRVESASINKVGPSVLSMLMLTGLAGSFIAIGAEFYTFVTFDSQLSFGLTKLIGGLPFRWA